MLRGNRVAALCGLLLLAGCAASGPTITTPTRSGAAVNAPAYRNGDQWHYHLTRSSGNNEQIRLTYRDGKFATDNQAGFDNYSVATVFRIASTLRPLDFPLTPGKTWQYQYRGTTPRGQTSWRDAVVKVIGPTAQPIQTKAGRFHAVELQRIETWGQAERRSTYFYSPDTKCVIKLIADLTSPFGNTRTDLELLSYKAGR